MEPPPVIWSTEYYISCKLHLPDGPISTPSPPLSPQAVSRRKIPDRHAGDKKKKKKEGREDQKKKKNFGREP
ncbi:uncharacterized protein BO95DRAFT_441800, partial [Aspergillus brunneoviolaceus CBS 621.78]